MSKRTGSHNSAQCPSLQGNSDTPEATSPFSPPGNLPGSCSLGPGPASRASPPPHSTPLGHIPRPFLDTSLTLLPSCCPPLPLPLWAAVHRPQPPPLSHLQRLEVPRQVPGPLCPACPGPSLLGTLSWPEALNATVTSGAQACLSQAAEAPPAPASPAEPRVRTRCRLDSHCHIRPPAVPLDLPLTTPHGQHTCPHCHHHMSPGLFQQPRLPHLCSGSAGHLWRKPEVTVRSGCLLTPK